LLSTALAAQTASVDGFPDTTFGNGGWTTQSILSGSQPSGTANSVVIGSDGKIAIGGTASVPAMSSTLGIIRLLPDGTLDASFGNLDGQPGKSAVDTSAAGLGFFYSAGFSLRSGSATTAYYFGGTSYLNNIYVAVALRVDDSGHLDTSFAGTGFALVNVGGATPHSLFARSVAPTADGGVVVGGDDYSVGSSAQAYLARFNAAGVQDTSFGDGGVVYLETASGLNGLNIVDLKTDADSNIVVGLLDRQDSSNELMAAMRVSGTGIIDTTFAGAGIAIVNYGLVVKNYDQFGHIHVQDDGKYVIAGTATEATTAACGIARLNHDGTFDTTFQGTGHAAYGASGCTDVAIQRDRRLIGISNPSAASPHAHAIRLAVDGSSDSIYANGISELPGTTPRADAVMLDAMQRPVIVGGLSPGAYVTRLTADRIFAAEFEF
jgi:uncharacterized delta-60 repeat protein